MKYRFWSQWSGGWSAAIAPIMTIPLHADPAPGARVGLRLPLWVGWEGTRWMVYGGGGPAFSGDADGRHSLFGGIVLARKLTPSAQVGMELNWQGAEHDGERPETGIGVGCIVPLSTRLVFHAAAGPRFPEGETPRYRFYMAVAAQF